MKDYIEKMLHIKVGISDYADIDKLPLYLKGSYQFYAMKMIGKDCLLAKPKENINFSTLRKQYQKLKKLSQLECVLYFDNVNSYAKQKLIEEAIPFVIYEKQIYMPFLGMIITNENDRLLPEIKEISFLTQKMLLIAIYQNWKKISLTDTAKVLCISKMSVTRCFDELEALGIPLILKEGKNRYFVWEKGCIALWNMVQPILRNPVIKEYRLEKPMDIKELPLGGISALSYYSQLNDNIYQTYAVTKEIAKSLKIIDLYCVPKGEEPGEVLQILQYEVPYEDGTAVDPLTTILSLSSEEKEESRVEVAIEQVLEEKISD